MMDLYQLITDRIISALENGTVPWHRAWACTSGAISRSTGKPYSVLNQMLLPQAGEYVTFRQAVEEGHPVKKGEKASRIFFKFLDTIDEDTGEKKTVPLLKCYSVFHISQCEGMKPRFASSVVKWAAFAAAIGPAVLVLGKVIGAVGKVSSALGTAFTAIGKFSAKVSMAGGGLGGLVKTLASSKLAMVALAAAVVYGAVKLVDYASGAKAAREALEGMAKTAKDWKETEADTFYSRSKGLSFFGMSKEDFQRDNRLGYELPPKAV